jgi:hypothetical protein
LSGEIDFCHWSEFDILKVIGRYMESGILAGASSAAARLSDDEHITV